MGLWDCNIAFKSPQNMMNYNMLFEIASFPSSYREVMESFFVNPSSVIKERNSWFARRVSLFFDIIRNRRYYSRFGYCSMERFLVSAVWAHFFDKEVGLQEEQSITFK